MLINFVLAAYVLHLSQAGVATSISRVVSPQAPVVLGGNLEGIADWSYSNAFADLMKQSRGFGPAGAPWTGTVSVDSNGWPTEDFGVILGTWPDTVSNGGTYKISFKCATTPTIGLTASPGSIQNIKRVPTTGIVTADLVCPANGSQLMLSFTNTKGGVTDLKVLRPGAASTDTFTQPFLKHCSRFSVFRFMDYQNTNGSLVKQWSDRTLPSAPTYANGNQVPWEVCIALCNKLHKDAWINVPHMADDAYVQSLATLFKNTLDSSLHVYVEYSNEVWNWSFVQATWNKNQAAADVAAGDPDLNYDNVNDGNVWSARRIAKRIKTISDDFKKVYGSQRWASTIRPVLATQIAWPGYWLVDGLTFLDARFGPPNSYLYACAGAPYFNMGTADQSTTLSKQDVLNALQAGVAEFATDLNVDDCATLARFYNLKFLGYEGGPDTFGPNNVAAKKAASLDPQMQSICATYLDNWYGYGFDLINWFVAGATSYDGPYGTWGLTDDMANQSTPKIKALDEVIAQKSVPLSKGIAVPGAIDPRQFAGRDATWATEGGLTLSLTDWRGPYRDYLIRNEASGKRSVTLSVGTNQTGVSLELWLNNTKVGVLALPNTGSQTTFENSSKVTFAIGAGMNVLRVKIVSGNGAAVNKITVD